MTKIYVICLIILISFNHMIYSTLIVLCGSTDAGVDQEEFPVHISELVKGNTKIAHTTTKITRQFSMNAQPSLNTRRGKLHLSLSVDQGIIEN